MPRRLLGAARAAWWWVTYPPHAKKLFTVVYLITMLIGVTTFLSPPVSLKSEIGPVLAVIWASCFLVGGTLGLLTVYTDWWWLERLALIIAAGGGVGVYGLVALMLHLASGTGSRLTQLGVISLAACVYIARWVSIRDYSYAPRPLTRER